MTRSSHPGLAWQWWLMIGLIVAAAIAGIVVQASRSDTEQARVVRPARVLGPGGAEIRGSATAPVLVEEWADFQCPACKAFHDRMGPTIDQLVQAGRVRFAFHHFAFIGEESTRAAAAATCAGDAGRFWEYHDRLYAGQRGENVGSFAVDRLLATGRDAGITGRDFTRFRQCVQRRTYDGWVRTRTDEASKAGIHSTPTVHVDGQPVPSEALVEPAAFVRLVDTAARG